MSAKPYLLLGALVVVAAALAFAISQLLVDVVGRAVVYGGDACPQRKLTCGTPPTGGALSVILGSAIASIVTLPIVRSTLEVSGS